MRNGFWGRFHSAHCLQLDGALCPTAVQMNAVSKKGNNQEMRFRIFKSVDARFAYGPIARPLLTAAKSTDVSGRTTQPTSTACVPRDSGPPAYSSTKQKARRSRSIQRRNDLPASH